MLDWLYTAISFVLWLWHSLFSRVLDPDSGITWALSILFLVVTVRILLFRFFIKQVKSQRAMQELQPDIAALRKQYGADRQGMAKAQQDLFKERGVNPLAGCLPILLQAPVFLSLFHVLRRLRPDGQGLYSWSDALTDSAAQASLFGAPISSQFNMTGPKEQAILALDGVTYGSIRAVAVVLIIVMSMTTYITQKQIIRKGGPVEGQAALIQKFMLYVIPLSLLVSGFFFPIGVLLYWFMNNLWTMGQQFYILHKMPPKQRAGEDKAARPAVDPKLLAPKPGAKPVHPKGKRAAATSAGAPAPVPVPDVGATDANADAPSAPPTAPPPTARKSSATPAARKPAGGKSPPGKSAPGRRPANSKAKRKKR
ncbi:membrane protein insertase YidC [soil metagenome]